MSMVEVEVTVDGDSIETRDLPLLDLAPYFANEPGSKESLAEELRRASEEVGFLALKNHGIPQELLDRSIEENKRFGALPMDEKLKIKVDQHQRGYIQPKATMIKHSTYHNNDTFDLNETTVFATEFSPDNPHVQAGKQFYSNNQWPENLPGFRETVEEYMTAMQELGKSLLPLWALALDLPEDYFEPYFRDNYTYYRMAHYPPSEVVGENEYALGAHADTGFMTLLPAADVEGLEILDTKGIWFRPRKVPGVIHVNIGQFLERWSNERFIATPHRVAIPASEDRYTTPVFVNPDLEPVVECLPTCHGPDNPPKYPKESYWDFFKWYMANTYPHYDDFHSP
ncbi:MAG: isopenicillin N synthase family oxygenase [Rhodospirillaceae bacterium]|nr:isopenicillin N synthase family oxygenase [Rhodospirillaceae bacterium]